MDNRPERPDNRQDNGPEEQDGQGAGLPDKRMMTWARNATLWRVERRMMSEKQLQDSIARKARQKYPGIGPETVRLLCDEALRIARSIHGVDDVAYAGVSVRSGVRSGRSHRAIAMRLGQKGIDATIAAGALEESNDLCAVAIMARKRAFGPFRREEADDRRLQKEYAAFARNGFSSTLTRRILGMSREEAEEIIAGAS